MSHYGRPLTAWEERRFAAIEQAQARADAIASENAYWFAKAAVVKAEEKAKRDQDVRARREIVTHLMQPQAAADLVFARATMEVPVNASDRKAPKKFCWMPRGTHEISAMRLTGELYQNEVVCDEQGAQKVQASFAEITRDGAPCWIDFAHRNNEAAAWVRGFSWDPARGIIVAVDWTPAGEEAVVGQVFLSFSPTFYVSETTRRVDGIVSGAAAGGLVNAPAFKKMPPILACAARDETAEIFREMLTKAGRPHETVFAIDVAIKHGFPPEEVAQMLRELP